jgi:site-specific DNA recombinase
MKPCFGYIRVSTQKQGEGVSLEAQKDAITAFASRSNLTVTKWFEEKETAAKSGRPVFTEMLKLLERGKAQGLIIHKIDRSARNLKDWAIIGDLSDAGVDVYFATESLDFRSRGGRLTADIQAVIASDFIRNLREETKKGIHGRLKQGLYPSGAPLGYINNGKGQAKTPDPIKAPLIKELFKLYGSGQYSLRTVRIEINQRGLRSTNGRPLALTSIEQILNNPFYCGIIKIKRTGTRFDGIHEPLISVSLFNRVQDIKAGRCGKKLTRHNHTYVGLFRCGLCDRPMSPERQKGHVYYRCQKPSCPTKTVRQEVLEAATTQAFEMLQIGDDEALALARLWDEDNPTLEMGEQRQSLELRISDETRRLERLTDLMVDGNIDKQAYQTRQSATLMRLAELREKLVNLPDEAKIETDRQEIIELMKNLVQLHGLANAQEKRILLENCFSNRIVVGKNVELEPYNWLRKAKIGAGVHSGAPDRYTYRTADITHEGDRCLKRILEIFLRQDKLQNSDP